MIELKQTEEFRKWRTRLKDERALALIASRLDRLAFGLKKGAAPLLFCCVAETKARKPTTFRPPSA